jgi:hypothetical protein
MSQIILVCYRVVKQNRMGCCPASLKELTERRKPTLRFERLTHRQVFQHRDLKLVVC